jgi:hypothetical protein
MFLLSERIRMLSKCASTTGRRTSRQGNDQVGGDRAAVLRAVPGPQVVAHAWHTLWSWGKGGLQVRRTAFVTHEGVLQINRNDFGIFGKTV